MSRDYPLRLLKIGGGIAGDFSVSVVFLSRQELEWKDVPLWAYFCQVSDSITSYGSYSGDVPNEKITNDLFLTNALKFLI